jgi:hypothetical protein
MQEVNGSHGLQARATDPSGNVGGSQPVTVTVSNLSDATAPTVVVTSPINNSTISGKGNVTISASASDDRAVTKIELFVDGSRIGICDTTNTCSANWNVSQVSSGTHAISAVAYDAAINSGTATITVTKGTTGGRPKKK